MTKRLMAALLCAVATLAFGGVATAQAKGLSYKNAKTLAKRLAEKQVRGRNVVSFHLQAPTRRSATRIDFSYDDRTADNVFCTARVIVTSTTAGRFTNIRARFTGSRCNGIPSEVLTFEAITRRAQRALRVNTDVTVDALNALERSTLRCRRVKVPRARRSQAHALFDIALVQALEGPNDAAVADFVAALVDADVGNPTLARGAAAWSDWLAIVRALPTVDDPCDALKAWAAAGYAADSAPIDFAAYRALDRRAEVDRNRIERAATFMALRGAFPNAAVGFTPDGLLTQVSAVAGITGGKGKLRAKPILG
jgi:hypothetical protein